MKFYAILFGIVLIGSAYAIHEVTTKASPPPSAPSNIIEGVFNSSWVAYEIAGTVLLRVNGYRGRPNFVLGSLTAVAVAAVGHQIKVFVEGPKLSLIDSLDLIPTSLMAAALKASTMLIIALAELEGGDSGGKRVANVLFAGVFALKCNKAFGDNLIGQCVATVVALIGMTAFHFGTCKVQEKCAVWIAEHISAKKNDEKKEKQDLGEIDFNILLAAIENSPALQERLKEVLKG